LQKHIRGTGIDSFRPVRLFVVADPVSGDGDLRVAARCSSNNRSINPSN
jgi:hypothetical protein